MRKMRLAEQKNKKHEKNQKKHTNKRVAIGILTAALPLGYTPHKENGRIRTCVSPFVRYLLAFGSYAYDTNTY